MSSLLINEKRIEELRELDDDGTQETLNTLIEMYISATEKALHNMEMIYANKDLEEMKKMAHSIRSSSLNIGADSMALAASEIEYSKDDSQLGQLLTLIQQSFSHVKSELTKFIV